MNKIIWTIIVLGFIGYFVHLHFTEGVKNRAEQAEQKRIEKEIEEENKAAMDQMVSDTNAIRDWLQKLRGDLKVGIRIKPILTIELERLWLNKRPILFTGIIKDIATYDQSQYSVVIGQSLVGYLLINSELQLSLRSSKEKIDSLLINYPDIIEDYGFADNIAVIAQIESIHTVYSLENEGKRREIKVGEGKLVELLYTGETKPTE